MEVENGPEQVITGWNGAGSKAKRAVEQQEQSNPGRNEVASALDHIETTLNDTDDDRMETDTFTSSSTDTRHGEEISNESSQRGESSNLGPFEMVFGRMEEGFRVKAYLSSTNKEPEECMLNLQDTNLCISQSTNKQISQTFMATRCEIPIDEIFKLEFGRTARCGKKMHPLTSFSIAVGEKRSLAYYDFEADSKTEREQIVSTLLKLLEAVYGKDPSTKAPPTHLATPKLTSQKPFKDLDTSIPDDDDGSVRQPIVCSPSLEDKNLEQVTHPSNKKREEKDETHEGWDQRKREEGMKSVYLEKEPNMFPKQGTTETSPFLTSVRYRGEPSTPFVPQVAVFHKEQEGDHQRIENSAMCLHRSCGRLMDVQEESELIDCSEIPEDGIHRPGGDYTTERSSSRISSSFTSNVQSSVPIQAQLRSGHPGVAGTSPATPIIIEEGLVDIGDGNFVTSVTIDADGKRSCHTLDDSKSLNSQTTTGKQYESQFMTFMHTKPSYAVGVGAPPMQGLYDIGWCSDDICANALTDVAKTCSGIFALENGKPALSQYACGADENGAKLSGGNNEEQAKYSCAGVDNVGQYSCGEDNTGLSSALVTQNPCAHPFSNEPDQYCLDRISFAQPTCHDDQMAVVEEYVKNALGAPSAMYSYFVESESKDLSAVAPREPVKPESPNLRSRVRNRATKRNAQAGRMRNLRKEMTFAAALKQSREHMHTIKTTQSFNDAQPRLKITNRAANQFLGSDLLSSVVNTMNQTIPDPTPSSQDEEDIVYYDSDPEDTRERTMTRGPRRVSADIRNVRDETLPNKTADFGKVRKKLSRKIDEDVVKDIVQVMQNDRLALMWHPTQTNTNLNKPPALVRLWIESGLQLIDGSFLLPKLTWVKASEETGLNTRNLQKLDLLDICRIRPTERIDRAKHPFASKRDSFIIETQADIHLFEAESPEERDRIVYGLKVVVARLASLLMLRDYRAAEEFFGSPQVPGQAPI